MASAQRETRRRLTPPVPEYEIIAREVSGHRARFEAIEARLAEVERASARLEAAALTTARALDEISRHWHAVYEAMRREEQQAGDLSEDLLRGRRHTQ
jgi:septal ring factor EnvC (AmiA/AmiB activator)